MSARRGYGQYCPLALAAELLCERWTLLVLSRVIDGCHRFSDIQRGVPRISPTLLSRRLEQLEDGGLIKRQAAPHGHGFDYRLTPAGEELEPIVMSLAVWGQRWSRDLTADDLDPAFLAWSMHTRLNLAAMPAGRTVIAFEFTGIDRGYARFWLVHEDGRVDMCLKHPGFDETVRVSSDIRRFVEAWRGFRSLRDEIAAGHIRVDGASRHARAFPNWLMLSALAPVPRCQPGPEQQLASRSKAAERPSAALAAHHAPSHARKEHTT